MAQDGKASMAPLKRPGQRKGRLPTPSCGEKPACLVQDTGWLSYRDADTKQIHSKPNKPFQQGSEKERTCTREQASNDRRL